MIPKVKSLIGKIVDWIATAIGVVVLFLGGILRRIWAHLIKRPLVFIGAPVRRNFESARGRVRLIAIAVLLLFIVSGTYVYPNPYNWVAQQINRGIDNVDKQSWVEGTPVLNRITDVRIPEAHPQPFKLGLDLVGGTELLYDADTTKVEEADKVGAVEGVRDVIERRVNAFGVAEPVVQTDKSGDQWRVLVQLAGVTDVDEAIKQIGETPLLEFKEANDVVPTITALTETQKKDLEKFNADALKKANDLLRRVLAGGDFAALARENSDDPGSGQAGGDLGWVKRGAFVEEFDKSLFDKLKDGEIDRQLVKTQFGYHIIQRLESRGSGADLEVHSRHILIKTKTEADINPPPADEQWKNTALSGTNLSRAQVVFDPQTSEPQVQLTFDEAGGKLFEEITQRNVGKQVAIFLDNQIISAPTVQEAITGGQAVINGDFTVQDAKLLSQRLNAGALPVPISLVSQQRVGATLGEVAVQRSLRAGIYGFILVALFMILYYRLPGFISVVALIVYVTLVLAIFKFWPVTLTLAGIAGFILSIGMAVDANVLIFERLKEELRRGRGLQQAAEEGFIRAWSSIFDSNASSLITCAILSWFGSSIVKGFALTLAVGILVSMFSAVWVTKNLLKLVMAEKTSRYDWLYGARRPEA
jgi:protein-export membrane protein SecD